MSDPNLTESSKRGRKRAQRERATLSAPMAMDSDIGVTIPPLHQQEDYHPSMMWADFIAQRKRLRTREVAATVFGSAEKQDDQNNNTTGQDVEEPERRSIDPCSNETLSNAHSAPESLPNSDYLPKEYQAKRKKFKEMRAKQTISYICRRKGWACLQAEMKKIKELKIATQESPSSFNDDDDDVGTEHRNRSTVNGLGVTPSKLGFPPGFPPPNDDRVALLEQKVNELTEKVSSMETMKQEMQDHMKAMQNLVNQLMQNQPQCECNKPEGVKCKLFRMVKEDIVAEGRWVTEDPSIVVHDIPLGHGSSKVWVDCAVEPTARLWRPAGDMERMKDAVGSVIAWPTDSIIKEGI